MAKRVKNTERQAPIASRVVRQMMVILVRQGEAVNAARPRLEDKHFFDDEAHWALVWDIICEWWDGYKRLPTQIELTGEIEQAIDESPEMLDMAQEKIVRKFIKDAFDFPIEEANVDWGLRALTRFLRERLQQELADELKKRTTPQDFGGFVGRAHKEIQQIDAMSVGEADLPFGKNWKLESIHKFSTGVDFLDHFLGGGHAIGECNTVIGPYGSCKTTLSVQLTCEAAKLFWKEYIQSERKIALKIAYIFFYEGTRLEMQQRFLVYVANIHKDTMENFQSFDDLSRTGDLKPYEERLYREDIRRGREVPGEYERMLQAQKVIDRNVRFIDCTGHDPKHPGRGSGLTEEIGSIMANEARRLEDKNQKPGIVIVDHASAAVERHISGADGRYDLLRHYLGKFPINMANNVCIPYQIPAWVMHQTDTKSQAKPPGHIPHHSDAAEAKNFGENAHFSFNLGTPDQDNLCVISCTKHRRRPPCHYEIIKINGGLGEVLGTNGQYRVDPSTQRIVAAGDLKKISKPVADSGELPPPANPLDASLNK